MAMAKQIRDAVSMVTPLSRFASDGGCRQIVQQENQNSDKIRNRSRQTMQILYLRMTFAFSQKQHEILLR